MNIVKLNGEDTELYRRVAHLVMNREVLASNNNYPFKTSSEHIWFVACDDEGRYHIRHPEQTHPGLQALRVFGNVRMGKIRENDIQRR